MIVFKLYAHGAGVKAVMEHHIECCDSGDCPEPDDEASEQGYPDQSQSVKECWLQCMGLLYRTTMRRSHTELLKALTHSEPLPFKWF